MDFITYVLQTIKAQLPQLIKDYEGDLSATSLSEMEIGVKETMFEVGQALVGQWLEAQEEKYPEDEKVCPTCGGQAQYVRRRQGVSKTLYGRVCYRRHYYCCSGCQGGFSPLDMALGIKPGQMSEQVVQLAALFGIEDAFGTGQDLLKRATFLELSANSLRKATQLVGQQVVGYEQALIDHSHALENQQPRQASAQPPERLYGSMDGFKVLFKDGWHEMKAGMWWTTRTSAKGNLKADQLRYYTDFLPAHDFAELVWATGFEQNAHHAHELIFIADGADWIWRIVDQHYPHAVQIVDWYHACAYLSPVAKVAFSDPIQQDQWLEQVKSDLWEGRLDEVIAACQLHLDPLHEDDPAQRAVTYYQNNRQRMAYALYRQLGYQIASGSMESGCKQLGLARLKIAGARWSPDGARLVAKARAAYLSNLWDELNSLALNLPQVA